MQSFVGHAVAIVVLGMIVPTSDEAKTPLRLVLAPPAEAEEPLGQESSFIEVPLPVEAQSELEPVPLEPPAVELLTVEEALPEPEDSAAGDPGRSGDRPADAVPEQDAAGGLGCACLPRRLCLLGCDGLPRVVLQLSPWRRTLHDAEPAELACARLPLGGLCELSRRLGAAQDSLRRLHGSQPQQCRRPEHACRWPQRGRQAAPQHARAAAGRRGGNHHPGLWWAEGSDDSGPSSRCPS